MTTAANTAYANAYSDAIKSLDQIKALMHPVRPPPRLPRATPRPEANHRPPLECPPPRHHADAGQLDRWIEGVRMKILVGSFTLSVNGQVIAKSLPGTPGVLLSDCGNVVGRLDHETGVVMVTAGPMASFVTSVSVLASRPPTSRTPLPHGPAQKGRGGKIRKWGRP